MSNIYIQEPPTSGKVLLKTSVGDIDVELWSKEAPKACRNFVQLCLENYYNGTIFHRLVKGFIVQGGDPNGDGTGGESIYGEPFKDEFHSRLRFVRRGLMAMSNAGKDDNGSQFFFTLGSTPELQNKHTIFGKVTGNTLYNMIKLEESLVDHEDRPLYPHKVISTEVLSNPFPDIVPRILKEKSEQVIKKPKEKVKKNFKLLSFGEEAEEDEAEIEMVNEAYKGQSKSSHDLIDDPKLSSIPAVNTNEGFSTKNESGNAALDKIRKKLDKGSIDKVQSNKIIDVPSEQLETNEMNETNRKRKEIRKQIRELKKELSRKNHIEPDAPVDAVEDEPEKEENDVLLQYQQELKKHQEKAKTIPKKGTSEREQQTLKMFEKFRNTMQQAKSLATDEMKDNVSSEDDVSTEDDDNESWLTHCLKADDQKIVLAKDANMESSERYDLSDPRNPLNQRRRNEKRKI